MISDANKQLMGDWIGSSPMIYTHYPSQGLGGKPQDPTNQWVGFYDRTLHSSFLKHAIL